jgi:hypothetical protein
MKLADREVKRIKDYSELDLSKICYWKDEETGRWMLYFPSCGVGNLANHKVVENADGTITVSPSILTEGHHKGERTQVHGYFENSKWRDV